MKSSIIFVGNHHRLSKRQSLALMRSTSSSANLCIREKKRLLPGDLSGRTVYIDGFNLIITLEVALSNGMLFIGQDGCIRDLAELRGTYRIITQTDTAIDIIRGVTELLKTAKVIFFLDEPVSNSGRLKVKIYEHKWKIPVEVQIVRSPDTLLKKLPYVITGDSIILNECISWFNITAYVLEHYRQFNGLSRIIPLNT